MFILKNNGIIISGIMVIIIVVMMASGCTSNSGNSTATPGYKSDIEVGAASYIYNKPSGEATGGCAVRNKGSIEYKKVLIAMEVYDAKGNVVGNETITVGRISPGEEINWVHMTGEPIPTGVSASATVIGATPV